MLQTLVGVTKISILFLSNIEHGEFGTTSIIVLFLCENLGIYDLGCSDMLAPPLWSTISTVMGIGFTARQAIPICFFGFLICGGVIGLTGSSIFKIIANFQSHRCDVSRSFPRCRPCVFWYVGMYSRNPCSYFRRPHGLFPCPGIPLMISGQQSQQSRAAGISKIWLPQFGLLTQTSRINSQQAYILPAVHF